MSPAELIPIPIEDAILWLAALSAVAAVLAVWSGLIAPRPLKARMRSLTDRRVALNRARLSPRSHPMRIRGLSVATGVVERLRLLQSAQARKIGEKLLQAGWRGKDAMVMYLFLKFALPITFGVVAVVFLYVLSALDVSDMTRLAIALFAVIIGAYLPDLFTSNTISRRRQKITKAMPDGLDLMVICAEAGLSLDAALERVGRELRQSWPEFADEIGLTSIELGFLPDRGQALQNLAKRVRISGMRGLVNTLAQTERYGTPLSQALRVLSSEMRQTRLMKAEEKAARLPAILTVPMIIFIMPALFVVLIGPGALSTMDALRNVL
jgi:tight adherence protein C